MCNTDVNCKTDVHMKHIKIHAGMDVIYYVLSNHDEIKKKTFKST